MRHYPSFPFLTNLNVGTFPQNTNSKKFITWVSLLLFGMMGHFVHAQIQSDLPAYEQGVIYLKVSDSSSFEIVYPPLPPPAGSSNPTPGIYTIFNAYGVTEVVKPFVLFAEPAFDRIYKVYFTNPNVAGFIAELAAINFVQYAERVPLKKTVQTIPNDSLASYQLGLIEAYDAFDLHQGGGAVVAIVDDAVLTSHEDLEDNIVAGRDVADMDDDPNPPFSGLNAVRPTSFSHGTHVAGIAGAVTNNNNGVASIGWNNKIMPVKCTRNNSLDVGSITHGFEGIVWAAENGADVINMSWGSNAFSESEYLCVQKAKQMGVILIAAAGNSNSVNATYPAAYGEGMTGQSWEAFDEGLVIAVASIDANGDRSSFSNYGPWVDVAAYGSGILSTLANSSNGTPINDTYGPYSGTSMASPLVAGLAGLMASYKSGGPPIDVIGCLLGSANPDVYDLAAHPNALPASLGSGRINAFDALRCIGANCVTPFALITPSVPTICANGSVDLTANNGVAFIWSTGETTREATALQSGVYTVTVTFVGGCTATASVTIVPAITEATISVTDNSGLTANDGILCGGNSDAEATLSVYWGLAYQWDAFGAKTPSISFITGINDPPVTVTYSVTVTGVGGCIGQDQVLSKSVTFLALPNSQIQALETSAVHNDGIICAGAEVTLSAAQGYMSYQWSTGDATSSVTVSPPVTTTYTVTITDIDGCISVGKQEISVPDASIEFHIQESLAPSFYASETDGKICKGSTATITVSNGTSTLWNTGETTQSITVSPQTTTTYSVTVTNGTACSGTATVTIYVGDPTVEIEIEEDSGVPNDGLVCLGSKAILTAQIIPSPPSQPIYYWSAISNTPSITVVPTTSTTYTVTVYDDYFCSATESVEITPEECFPCGCNDPGQLNIDADPVNGTLWSTYAQKHNLPDDLDFSAHKGCIAISGKLVIDKDVTVSFAYDMKMQPCSEIVVGNSSTPNNFPTLSLGTTYLSGCERMWKGITVMENCSLTTSRAALRDAQFGILAHASDETSTLPPTTAKIRYTSFQGNHVGVLFDNPSNYSNPIVRHTHAPFIDNYFNGINGSGPSGTLLPPCDPALPNYEATSGYAGVISLGPYLGVGVPWQGRYFNHFRNLRNGVIGENNRLLVYSTKFENIIGYMGIGAVPSAWSSRGVGVVHNSGTAIVDHCSFDQCGHAILGNDDDLTAKDNIMPDVQTGISSSNAKSLVIQRNQDINFRDFGIWATTISPLLPTSEVSIEENYLSTLVADNDAMNTEVGIYLSKGNGAVAQNVRISGNKIYAKDNVDGINISNLGNLTIDGNEVYFQNHLLGLPHNTNGIGIYNSARNYLYGNTVKDETNVAGTTTGGFYIGTSPETDYCCNTTEGTNQGISFGGNCSMTSLKHQSMTAHDLALFCAALTAIGDQPDAISFPTGNHSNRFNPTCGEALHEGSSSFVGDSQFPVKTNQNLLSDWPEGVSTPFNLPTPQLPIPPQWFYVTGNPVTDCSSDCDVPPVPPRTPSDRVDDTDIHLVNGHYGADPRSGAFVWDGQMRLYDRMQLHTTMTGINSAVDAFYAQAQSGAIGQYHAVQDAIINLGALPSAWSNAADLTAQNIASAEAARSQWFDQLPSAQTVEDSSAIYQAADSIWGAASPNFVALMECRAVADSLRNVRAASALVQNEALTAVNLWQTNQKTVNRIYLQTLGHGIDTLTQQQFDDIALIAEQCPLEGGAAVYIARALYLLKAYRTFWDQEACSALSQRSPAARPPASDGINLFPNPASDEILLTFPAAETQLLTVKITDLSGQVLWLERLANAPGPVRIDLGRFANGLYFCTSVQGGRSFAPVKFVVQH